MRTYRRTQTRLECMRCELPKARRYTYGQSSQAFRRRAQRGWVPNLPPDGPPLEMAVWVRRDDPLVDVLNLARKERRDMPVQFVEHRLGYPIRSAAGLDKLGRAGLAVVEPPSGVVRLQAIDVRAATIVNSSRHITSRSGISASSLVEAFLPVRHPDRQRLHVTDERRLNAAIILENDFNIDAMELVECRDRIHLRSGWMI